MINPVQLKIIKPDGSPRYLIMEPVIEKSGSGLQDTGVFRIYKDDIGEESVLFTEPLEIAESGNRLPDADNPDYLGSMIFEGDLKWHYEGDLLNNGEQAQLAAYIKESR